MTRLPTYREWVELTRLQALPITIAPFVLGYVTSSGELGEQRFLWVLASVIVIHGCLMVQNEVFDEKYDKRAGRAEKPLVRNNLDSLDILTISHFVLILTLVGIFFIVELRSSFLASISVVSSIVYNFASKKKGWSDVFMGIALGSLVLFGASIGPHGITPVPYILSAQVFLIGTVVHIIADLKDVGSEEVTYYDLSGCGVWKTNGRIHIELSKEFIMTTGSFTVGYTFLSFAPYLSTGDVGPGGLINLTIAAGSLAVFWTTHILAPYHVRKIEKMIILYVFLAGVTLVIPVFLFGGIVEGGILLIACLLIPSVMQTALYGSPITFP